MIIKEIKIMITPMSKWWFVTAVAGIGLSFLVNGNSDFRMAALLILLPLPILGKMGCIDKYYGTEMLLNSSCSTFVKWIVTLIAGILISFIICSGILIRFFLSGEVSHLIAWSIGIVFIAVLALMMGSFSGSSKIFEGIYITWFYFGPINHIGKLDFIGVTGNNTMIYILLTIVLFAIGMTMQLLKEKRLIGIGR